MMHYDETEKLFFEALSQPEKTSSLEDLVGQDPAPAQIIALYAKLNEKFETDWWEWEPETLWKELGPQDDSARNAILALQLVTQSYAPFESWHIFENVCNAFSGEDVNFSIVQPAEPDAVAKGVRVLQALRPKTEFEGEVLAYIAACAKNAGLVYLPPDLFPEECQKHLDKLGNDLQLRNLVKTTWPRVVEEETPLGIQTQRLAEIREALDG